MTLSIKVVKHEPRQRFDFMRNAVAWADDVGPLVRGELKRRAPVGQRSARPGRLRDSIRYSRRTSAETVRLEFTANTPYTGFVLHGTRPHVISARAARVLHWRDDSGDHFRRMVHHPGTQPNPFNVEAVEATRFAVYRLFREHMQRGGI